MNQAGSEGSGTESSSSTGSLPSVLRRGHKWIDCKKDEEDAANLAAAVERDILEAEDDVREANALLDLLQQSGGGIGLELDLDDDAAAALSEAILRSRKELEMAYARWREAIGRRFEATSGAAGKRREKWEKALQRTGRRGRGKSEGGVPSLSSTLTSASSVSLSLSFSSSSSAAASCEDEACDDVGCRRLSSADVEADLRGQPEAQTVEGDSPPPFAPSILPSSNNNGTVWIVPVLTDKEDNDKGGREQIPGTPTATGDEEDGQHEVVDNDTVPENDDGNDTRLARGLVEVDHCGHCPPSTEIKVEEEAEGDNGSTALPPASHVGGAGTEAHR